MKPIFLFIPKFGLIGILFLVSGCATMSGTSTEGANDKIMLSVAKSLRFEDVPIPVGFKLIENQSFSFQNDRSRVALLKYHGAGTADNVVEFYKSEMSAYNWDAINIVEYDRRVLNYENPYETCIITVEPQGGKSLVTIAISPKSKAMKNSSENRDKGR